MKKIYVMIGNYGSGKSELALNFAFKAAETGKTELIDLDLVNTYFRLTERGKLVEQKEIRLISPNYAWLRRGDAVPAGRGRFCICHELGHRRVRRRR